MYKLEMWTYGCLTLEITRGRKRSIRIFKLKVDLFLCLSCRQ